MVPFMLQLLLGFVKPQVFYLCNMARQPFMLMNRKWQSKKRLSGLLSLGTCMSQIKICTIGVGVYRPAIRYSIWH